MRHKFILKEIGSDEPALYFTTYGKIAEAIGITYADCRAINYMCENRMEKKFMHKNLKELSLKWRIFDNPI
jgi:hypothetical protein